MAKPSERLAWGLQGRSRIRFEASIGPALVGVFPQNPAPPDPSSVPAPDPTWMPAPITCGVGGQITLGFRHVSEYRPLGDSFFWKLVKIPVIGWLLFAPLVPIILVQSSVVSGDQIGLDLRFAVLGPCGAEGARYTLGLRPVLRFGRYDSRVRLPSILGMILPEPMLILEANQTPQLELGFLRLPIAVLLTPRLGIEVEPSLGYRVSYVPSLPSSFTLNLGVGLVLR